MSEPMIIANKYNEIITDLINDTVLEQNEVTIEGQVNHYAYNVDNYYCIDGTRTLIYQLLLPFYYHMMLMSLI